MEEEPKKMPAVTSASPAEGWPSRAEAPAQECPHLFGYRAEVILPNEEARSHRSTLAPDVVVRPRDEPMPAANEVLCVSCAMPGAFTEYRVSHASAGVVLEFRGIATFLVTERQIEYCLSTVSDAAALPWLLYGVVFACWLELRGDIVLHGAAVDVAGNGVGFLGRSGAGKSTLAAAFLKHGHTVFGDDHVVVGSDSGLSLQPGVPWLKVSKDVSTYLGLQHAALPRLHPTAHFKRRLDIPTGPNPTRPLKAIYIVNRLPLDETPHAVRIERLNPIDAVSELIVHSYAARTVRALGLQPGRLPALSAIANHVGVWRLSYREGFDHLSAVRAAVAEHQAAAAS